MISSSVGPSGLADADVDVDVDAADVNAEVVAAVGSAGTPSAPELSCTAPSVNTSSATTPSVPALPDTASSDDAPSANELVANELVVLKLSAKAPGAATTKHHDAMTAPSPRRTAVVRCRRLREGGFCKGLWDAGNFYFDGAALPDEAARGATCGNQGAPRALLSPEQPRGAVTGFGPSGMDFRARGAECVRPRSIIVRQPGALSGAVPDPRGQAKAAAAREPGPVRCQSLRCR